MGFTAAEGAAGKLVPFGTPALSLGAPDAGGPDQAPGSTPCAASGWQHCWLQLESSERFFAKGRIKRRADTNHKPASLGASGCELL